MDNLLFILSMLWKILFITFFFGFCVFIHEFGHLIIALWRGLHVEKFSIGFGKRIWGFNIKGVEYVVSILPFGGYVMLPQLDPTDSPETSDGKPLPSSKPVDRIYAAFAGPIFNIVFGFLLATVMWMVGVWEPPPASSCIVTNVPKILPAYKDGLRLTDQVIAVNGEESSGYWEDISSKLEDDKQKLALKVLRGDDIIELDYQPEANPEWQGGLRPGFRIIAVNGKKFSRGFDELSHEYVLNTAAQVKLSVIDNEGQERELSYRPAANPLMENLPFPFFSAEAPVSAGEILAESNADKAGLKKGDQLLELNGTTIKTSQEFSEELQKITPGSLLSLKVSRQDKEIIIENLQMPENEIAAASALGIFFNVRAENVLPGRPAANAGMQTGDLLISIDGKDIASVDMFVDSVRESAGMPFDLQILRDGALREITVKAERAADNEQAPYQIGVQLSGSPAKIIAHPNPWKQFTNVVEQTGRTLGLLFSPLTRKVKAIGKGPAPEAPATSIKIKHMSGPLGIIMMLWYKLKLEGIRGGLSFIILITFSLAMVNLLPLPVLDGGHIAYAALELIFRRKIPVKVMAILQNTFAVLLIALMLYITAFDGKRIFQRINLGIHSKKSVEQSEKQAIETIDPVEKLSDEQTSP